MPAARRRDDAAGDAAARQFPDGTDNITLGGFEPIDRVASRGSYF